MRLEDLLIDFPDPHRVAPSDVRDHLDPAAVLFVLDDDPTGTQPIAHLPVLTRWDPNDLAWALDTWAPAIFVLTNSRSLGPEAARDITVDVARACLAAAESANRRASFVSRSDSTLRGHYAIETETLAEERRRHDDAPPELLLVVPAFPAAGRVTVDSEHYLRNLETDELTKASDSEFARDASFGYSTSNLPEFVAEKTERAVSADDVLSLTLATIRRGPEAIAGLLLASRTSGSTRTVVVDAVTDDDLRGVARAAQLAEVRGATFLYRTGPTFVRALTGQDEPAVVDPALLDLPTEVPGGLVVVGSHVGVTTRQLESLLGHSPRTEVFEIEVARILDDDLRERHLADLAERASSGLAGGNVVVATERRLVSDTDKQRSLEISRAVSAAVVDVVRRITANKTPRFVIAKGGITSHDVAMKALEIYRAEVMGPMLPGIISMWMPVGARSESPYVVFPGNVGGDDALATVVDHLSAPFAAPDNSSGDDR